VLQGDGPDDLRTVCLELAVQMIKLSQPELPREQAEALVFSALESGDALEKFTLMVEAQGGDPRVVDDTSLLGETGRVFEYRSDSSGYVVQVQADLLGLCAVHLGAGRHRAEDPVDTAVGLSVLKKIGEEVEAGEPLVRVHFREESQLQGVLPYLEGAFKVEGSPCRPPELIRKVVC
jgi:pyrimidine-nucleoside phosphorylase